MHNNFENCHFSPYLFFNFRIMCSFSPVDSLISNCELFLSSFAIFSNTYNINNDKLMKLMFSTHHTFSYQCLVIFCVLNIEKTIDNFEKWVRFSFESSALIPRPKQANTAPSPQNVEFWVVNQKIGAIRTSSEITGSFLIFSENKKIFELQKSC